MQKICIETSLASETPSTNTTAPGVPLTLPETLHRDIYSDQCEFVSSTEHGVKVHKGRQHKNNQKPEEFWSESLKNSLWLSFLSEEREENMSIPPFDTHPISEEVTIEQIAELFQKMRNDP